MLIRYLLIIFLLFEISLAQSNIKPIYPYGGILNHERYNKYQFNTIPLDFPSDLVFRINEFNEIANFGSTHFMKLAKFSGIWFNFSVDFRESIFNQHAYFNNTVFDSIANFKNAVFKQSVNFEISKFFNKTNFENTKFCAITDFKGTHFLGGVNFKKASFLKLANFKSCIFYRQVDFYDVSSSDSTFFDFRFTQFRDTIRVGSASLNEISSLDFRWSMFIDKGKQIFPSDIGKKIEKRFVKYPGAKIIVSGPVDLKIQIERFKYITIEEKLDYYTKKNIITTLKNISFNNDGYSKERYELDYLFEKSTMYQKKSIKYEKEPFIKKIRPFIYEITMGLGYKPFKLFWCIIFVFIIFSFLYFIFMRSEIEGFIKHNFKKNQIDSEESKLDLFTNSLFFSFTNFVAFFNIKLAAQTLLYFTGNKKILIVFQWTISSLIYLSFLAFHKSGSIGQGVIDIFVP